MDPSHTSIYFAVSHYGISFVRGRFGKMSAQVRFDPEAKTGTIAIRVDADSVDTGNKQLDNVLSSAQFLDANGYPQVYFVADHFVFEADKLTAIDGTLTLQSVQRPLRLTAQRFVCRDVAAGLAQRHVCGGAFHAAFNRSEFGMTRFLPDVGDEVELAISVEASRR